MEPDTLRRIDVKSVVWTVRTRSVRLDLLEPQGVSAAVLTRSLPDSEPHHRQRHQQPERGEDDDETPDGGHIVLVPDVIQIAIDVPRDPKQEHEGDQFSQRELQFFSLTSS